MTRTTDPEAPARRALARHRAFATSLLGLMAALTVGTYWMPPGLGTAWLQASAKAGFVGGVADWFAVTALFRHPLGLPIPHTAILPRQKHRLGAALGGFVANHVFTAEEVKRVLGRLDFAAILQRFLTDPAAAHPAAEAFAGALPRLLAMVEDGRVRRIAGRLIPRLVGGPATGQVVARALRGLVASGRHQEVLTFLLGELREAIAAKEDVLRQAIEERVREQGGRLVGWAMGASVARRVLAALHTELERIGPEGSEIRTAFDEWVGREITRLEEDPARAAELGAAIRRVVAHDTVQAWIWDIWARLRLALEADAARPNGHIVAFAERVLGNLGTVLEADPVARARLQQAAEGILIGLLPSAREQLSDFIAGVVASWDTATVTDRLELRVGKDLQYVRVNGTLVGFLIGGLVWALLMGTFGQVSF